MARTTAGFTLTMSAILLASCSPEGNGKMAKGPEDHFTCAAMIGALDQLVSSGQVPQDAVPANTRLTAGMTHLNAWAIPNNLQEKEAFEKVKEERSRLIATLTPGEITARAKACIEDL